MSKVFCGIGKIPKGKKRGNMKDCAKARQVRFYGLKKIDQLLVDSVAENKKLKKTSSKEEDLILQMVTTGGKIRKVTGQIKSEKDKKEKEKLKKELMKLQNKQDKIKGDIRKIKSKK